MNNTEKIKLLSEIEDLIIELGGINDMDFHRIGISMTEYENPTVKTVARLRNYVDSLHKKKEEDLVL